MSKELQKEIGKLQNDSWWTKVMQGRWPIDWKLQQKWEQLDKFIVDEQIKSVWEKYFTNL